MNNNFLKNVTPLDSYSTVFKTLAIAGYYKLLKRPKYRILLWAYYIYRRIVVVIVAIYILLHIIYVIQVRNEPNKFIIGLIYVIPHFNLIMKYQAMNLNVSRFDKLQDLMNDRIFGANNHVDMKYLEDHSIEMNRLAKFINGGLFFSLTLWVLNPIAGRIQDGHFEIPIYTPFETVSWLGFILAIFLECGPILWIGYGHLALDCTIATYFAQSVVQLKIIKYNLEHLFDMNDTPLTNRRNQCNDVTDEVYNRFLYYVRRYEKVIWFTAEVNSIFNTAIAFQFLTILVEICLIIFGMSNSPILSTNFMLYLVFYLAIQTQIFIYCYYGGLVLYESSAVANAVYLSDWVSLSPRFRRLLLIAMTRWSLPITPRVIKIVPLSLVTFISITRSAYSLFTVLKTSNTYTAH